MHKCFCNEIFGFLIDTYSSNYMLGCFSIYFNINYWRITCFRLFYHWKFETGSLFFSEPVYVRVCFFYNRICPILSCKLGSVCLPLPDDRSLTVSVEECAARHLLFSLRQNNPINRCYPHRELTPL